MRLVVDWDCYNVIGGNRCSYNVLHGISEIIIAHCRHQGSDDSGYLGQQGEDIGVPPPAPGVPVSNNQRWMLYKISKQSQDKLEPPGEDDKQQKRLSAVGDSLESRIDSLNKVPGSVPSAPVELANQGAVQAMSDRIAVGGIPAALGGTPVDGPASAPEGNFKGLLSQAKAGLSGSVKPPPVKSYEPPPPPEVKKSESDLQWEELEKNIRRSLKIRDLDFTDLNRADDTNFLNTVGFGGMQGTGGGGPGAGAFPPPPPMIPGLGPPPPPPPPGGGPPMPPPPPLGAPPLPPPSGAPGAATLAKKSKTVKLHWKDVRIEPTLPSGRPMETVWTKVTNTCKCGHLHVHKHVICVMCPGSRHHVKRMCFGCKIFLQERTFFSPVQNYIKVYLSSINILLKKIFSSQDIRLIRCLLDIPYEITHTMYISLATWK